jgi:hypothetical protein
VPGVGHAPTPLSLGDMFYYFKLPRHFLRIAILLEISQAGFLNVNKDS